MIESLFLAALFAQAQPAPENRPAPQPLPPAESAPARAAPQFSVEDRARLRCATAFSFIALREETRAATPDFELRGREFFVVTLADLMDTYKLDRPTLTDAVQAEAQALARSGEVDAMMPACLLMLEASGL